MTEEQRLAEGGRLLLLSREHSTVRCAYVDDFGIVGGDFLSVPCVEEEIKVKDSWLAAKGLVIALDFKVHRDCRAHCARVTRGDPEGTHLALNQEKQWIASPAVRESLDQNWEFLCVNFGIVVVSSWGFLICQRALSTFSEVYRGLAVPSSFPGSSG